MCTMALSKLAMLPRMLAADLLYCRHIARWLWAAGRGEREPVVVMALAQASSVVGTSAFVGVILDVVTDLSVGFVGCARSRKVFACEPFPCPGR